MTPEDLINLLHEKELDDKTIKELLSEALASLEPEPEVDEKEEAKKMLGVEFE